MHIIKMWVCEQNHLILAPGRVYKFYVDDSCSECRAIGKIYGYEASDIDTWENEGGRQW